MIIVSYQRILQFLTFSSVSVSVLILKADIAPKDAEGANAIAGAAKKRGARASFMVDIICLVKSKYRKLCYKG